MTRLVDPNQIQILLPWILFLFLANDPTWDLDSPRVIGRWNGGATILNKPQSSFFTRLSAPPLNPIGAALARFNLREGVLLRVGAGPRKRFAPSDNAVARSKLED